MDYAKMAILAASVVFYAGFSSSVHGDVKPRVRLEPFNNRQDELYEVTIEEMTRQDVGQDPSVTHRLRKEMELLGMNAQEMRTELAFLREKNWELETRLDKQQAEARLSNRLLKDYIDRRMTKFDQSDGGNSSKRIEISLPISFSAYKIVQAFPYNLPGQTLVFDREFVNDYDGYDKTTGVFTAPISGVYVFSFYIVESGYNWFNATLMVEDTVVAAAKADRGEQFVTGGSVVRVNKGEKVRVRCTGDSEWSVFWMAAGFSRFSGYLLYVS